MNDYPVLKSKLQYQSILFVNEKRYSLIIHKKLIEEEITSKTNEYINKRNKAFSIYPICQTCKLEFQKHEKVKMFSCDHIFHNNIKCLSVLKYPTCICTSSKINLGIFDFLKYD